MEFITLENGLRLAFEHKKDAMSATVSIYVGSGSVCESDDIAGTAHFIEHMVFKGSEKYSNRDIARLTDMYGGNINAYTTKEYTCFYARALTEHFCSMLDIITDMVANPTFDGSAVSTEKGVVIEEIGMYEDSPEDLGYDLLGGAVWKGSPLSHIILGTRESVSAFSSSSLFQYHERFYSPERTVISICGNYDKDSVLKIIGDKFEKKKNLGFPIVPIKTDYNKSLVLHKKDAEQTCVFLAFPAFDSNTSLRHAIALYTEITGGGAASRMNMRIREDLGLAYNTYAYNNAYLGCGAFGVFAGLSPDNQGAFLKESLDILNGMTEFSDEDELYRVKQQFKAGMIMSGESMQGVAASVGKQLLLRGEYTDVMTAASMIDKVTAEDIRKVAKLLFNPEECSLCVVGSPKSKDYYFKEIEKYI